jgi:hypothetical protein
MITKSKVFALQSMLHNLRSQMQAHIYGKKNPLHGSIDEVGTDGPEYLF